VYLLSLSYTSVNPSEPSTDSAALASLGNSTLLHIRVNFMGLCARLPSGDWTCSSSVSRVADAVKGVSVGQNASYDPLDLVNIARNFKDGVIFEGLLYVLLEALFYCGFNYLAAN
jgi:hypothetical protein